jgi:hypothetical protein
MVGEITGTSTGPMRALTFQMVTAGSGSRVAWGLIHFRNSAACHDDAASLCERTR